MSKAALRPKFWEKYPLSDLSQPEWEALCDGCGRCCLNKLEDADTSRIVLTRVACRLLDGDTCQCAQYDIRHQFVPDCIVLSLDTLPKHQHWLPGTCAYKRLYDGKSLPDWHPLLTGDPQSVHDAEVSVQGWTVPENEIPEEDWEDHIIEDIT